MPHKFEVMDITMGYTEEELARLHEALYEVLGEVVRVCDILHIPFFMIGGSAIGCFFWKGIIPFDDDIDVGMTRENYNRFLREAPQVLGKDYFLQWMGTEPHTPFYFAKVRRNNTVFVEDISENLPIHQGIFVDVIPFDRVPDSSRKERWQRKLANTLLGSFVSKELWQWRYFGKCECEEPKPHGVLSCLFDRLMVMLVPKKTIYRWMEKCQTWYNGKSTRYYNNVMIEADHVEADSIEHLEKVPFGPYEVGVPARLETYLKHHYPTLKKDLTEEERLRYSHRPKKIVF